MMSMDFMLSSSSPSSSSHEVPAKSSAKADNISELWETVNWRKKITIYVGTFCTQESEIGVNVLCDTEDTGLVGLTSPPPYGIFFIEKGIFSSIVIFPYGLREGPRLQQDVFNPGLECD